MNLHYKIVEVWPNDHLIVTRYWTDNISEEFLASDVNRREDGSPARCRSDVAITLPIPAPTGKELEELIVRNAPLEWLKTLEKVQAPEIDTSMSEILKIKDNVNTVDVNEKPKQIDGTLSDEEIQEMINKITSNDK
jgi:hypothetical protein